MFPFQYYTPTRVVFGNGTENQVGSLVKAQGGHKVLIHYGGGSVVRSGASGPRQGVAGRGRHSFCGAWRRGAQSAPVAGVSGH